MTRYITSVNPWLGILKYAVTLKSCICSPFKASASSNSALSWSIKVKNDMIHYESVNPWLGILKYAATLKFCQRRPFTVPVTTYFFTKPWYGGLNTYIHPLLATSLPLITGSRVILTQVKHKNSSDPNTGMPRVEMLLMA